MSRAHREAMRRPLDVRGPDGPIRRVWSDFCATFAGQVATVTGGVWRVGNTICCHAGESDGEHVVPVAADPFGGFTDDPSGMCDRGRGGDLAAIFGGTS